MTDEATRMSFCEELTLDVEHVLDNIVGPKGPTRPLCGGHITVYQYYAYGPDRRTDIVTP